jgi:CubicO group peptidase (beta-lactamase class C family)
MTVRHLLNHTSGYPATAAYYRQIANADRGDRSGMMTSRCAVESIYSEIFRAKLDNLPGKVTRYSDIGFILLGHALEVVSGMNLDKLFSKFLMKNVRVPSSGFVDIAVMRRRGLETVNEIIAPTAECPWRRKILCGEVHDDNAWAMGGVAAHAGLFTTATDIHTIASELINCYHGRSDTYSPDLVKEFWTRRESDPEGNWALGWETAGAKKSSAGQYFSTSAVGHSSYTGCSLWIDPERELDVVLLSNRIHPSPDTNSIREFRPVIHDLVMESLGYV